MGNILYYEMSFVNKIKKKDEKIFNTLIRAFCLNERNYAKNIVQLHNYFFRSHNCKGVISKAIRNSIKCNKYIEE